MGGERAETAVVVGAGLGGLCAAAALHGRVPNVVVVERDRLPAGPDARRGVPQSGQLHNLLGAAQSSLDRLFPGSVDAIVEAGGVRGRVSLDTYVYELGLRMPERDLGLSIVCAPRTVIEHTVRSMVAQLPGVRLVDATAVVGVHTEDGVATGIKTGSGRVTAALVVDAGGASSPFPRWLADAGIEVPTQQQTAHTWYGTARYRLAAGAEPSRFLLVFPTPPRTRGGLVSPVGATEVNVSLNGVVPDDPPRDHAEFRRYAASLEDQAIADLLATAEPVSDPTVFRRPTVVWRRYDRMAHTVAGLLPLGDSLATLDPLHGQGVAVAATEACALVDALDVHPQTTAELTADYLRRAAEIIRRAWELRDPSPPAGSWWEALRDPAMAAALRDWVARDEQAHRVYVSAWHLLQPMSELDRLRPAPGILDP